MNIAEQLILGPNFSQNNLSLDSMDTFSTHKVLQPIFTNEELLFLMAADVHFGKSTYLIYGTLISMFHN